jgi:hypothetical protein
VAPLALAGAGIAWAGRAQNVPPPAGQHAGLALGGAALVLAFLLLIGERSVAGASRLALPEAPALRSIGVLATITCFAGGLLEMAAQAGLPYATRAGAALALLLGASGIELAARAAARLFLPPPAPFAARGVAGSLIGRLAVAGFRAQGVATPIRDHFGIDFSRSWALAYVRAAFMPMLIGLGLLGWGLSGLVLVPLDARAIYERFGAPVAVLHPGLHLTLPWPMGAARRIDFGVVHEIGLAESGPATGARPSAEEPSPAEANRLWEQAHPGEVTLVIASANAGKSARISACSTASA